MMDLLLLMVVMEMYWGKKRKNIIALFKNERLSITIANNLFETGFFDVPSNLVTGKFSPFRKPNNLPLYINTKYNHPPTFIKSWNNNHTNSFPRWHHKQDRDLSKHIWKLQVKGINFTVKCSITAYASIYRCGSRKCNVYLTEKYVIARATQKNLLNKRISKCRHKNKYIFKKIK